MSKCEVNLENVDAVGTAFDEMSQSLIDTLSTLEDSRNEMIDKITTLEVSDEKKAAMKAAVNSLFDLKESDVYNTVSPLINKIYTQVGQAISESDWETVQANLSKWDWMSWFGIGDDTQENLKKSLSETISGDVRHIEAVWQTEFAKAGLNNKWAGLFLNFDKEWGESLETEIGEFSLKANKIMEKLKSGEKLDIGEIAYLNRNILREKFNELSRIVFKEKDDHIEELKKTEEEINALTEYFVEQSFKALNKNAEDVKKNNRESWQAEYDFQRQRVIELYDYPPETIREIEEKGLQTGYASVTGMAMGITLGDTLATAAAGGVMESVRLAAGGTDLSTQGYNVMNTYSNGFNGGKGLITGTLSGLSSEVSSILDIDLTENGRSIGDTLADGIYASVNGAGGVVDLYNKLLGKSEEFSVQIMNAYNDAVPELRGILAGIGGVVGASVGQLEFINYTAKGRQVESVERFATGGFPDEGQLFIANENGPEMVGQIGSRTAVANQGQITDAIYMAVLDAMRMSGKNTSQGQGDVHVYIDSDEVSARVEQRQYARSKRLGG